MHEEETKHRQDSSCRARGGSKRCGPALRLLLHHALALGLLATGLSGFFALRQFHCRFPFRSQACVAVLGHGVLDLAANVGGRGKVTSAVIRVTGQRIDSIAQTRLFGQGSNHILMLRNSTLALATFFGTGLFAQQIALDWATPLVPANNRVKLASTGGVYSFGTGDDSAVIQRISEAGTVQWTKTLSAPQLRAVDMDVDAADNIYVYLTFETGQLDLDPGPNTTLVDPGKVYAKYNSSGAFQWGGVLENLTDASEDYGAVSCDDAGNLYICGDLGLGTYDFDFGTGVSELTVGDFSTGSFMARYRPDGSLAWANIETYYGGFCNSRDISVMDDGSSFFVIRELDNGGPLSSQIDIDYGPGEYNVYTETQHILRYDSALQFMAEGSTNYYQCRLACDANGSAYVLGYVLGGLGGRAAKYNQDGTDMEQVYITQLYSNGNLRLGDVVPDEQGGCLGMYSLNCDFSTIRFYKMNVSGLVDFNLYINSGTDCTLPGGKGFDLDGSAFYVGTYNGNYEVDFDPGPGTVSLPSVTTDDGVVARYTWCAGTPFDPFEINTSGALCVGTPATFTVSAFGDASSYDWTVPVNWTITDGQGTGTITVQADIAGSGTVSVLAVNDCGASAPIALDFAFSQAPLVDLGPDQVICPGNSIVLDAGVPGASYEWIPDNGEFTQTITVSPTISTTYSVIVSVNGCSGTDQVTVVVDPCLGIEAHSADAVKVWPIPVTRDGPLFVEGLATDEPFIIVGVDGRIWTVPSRANSTMRIVDVAGLAPGVYTLRTSNGAARPFVIAE